MINQPIQNGGLGERGSPNNKMRSAYDNYNSYRGEMENARATAEKTYDEGRVNASMSMSADGVKRNSPEWNKTMAGVSEEFSNTITKATERFEAYKTGTSFKSLEADYKKGTVFDKTQGLTETQFEITKPSFNEFYDMQFGTPEKMASAASKIGTRKSNLNMGAG